MPMITAFSCGKEDSLIVNFRDLIMPTKRICLWSSPRNISTAMMYSFAQRPDTIVFDEPLYAHYLRVTGIDHPGKWRLQHRTDTNTQRTQGLQLRAHLFLAWQ